MAVTETSNVPPQIQETGGFVSTRLNSILNFVPSEGWLA